jgi:hypothetical protein
LKKIIFFIAIILLHANLILYSQVKEPELPFIEEINESIDLQSFNYKARISIQGKTGFTEGALVLNSDVLIYPDKRQIKVKDISRITVIMWEKRSRLNQHMFYPSRYEIFYRDYRKEVLNGNIESLNKIKISNKKRGIVYFYYYDYFKNGRWASSGVADFDAFSLEPAEGCGVSIELIQ